jgi:hypothetical protein
MTEPGDPEKDASPLDHAPPSAPFMLGGIMAKITVYLSPKTLCPDPCSVTCRPALDRVRTRLEREIYWA